MAEREKAKIKAKVFARAYIQEGLNGTRAYLRMRPDVSVGTARSQAPVVIAKPSVQRAIIETMEEIGLNDELVEKIHKRNLKQSKNYAASNTAVEMYLKIKGHLKDGQPVQNHLHLHSDVDIQTRIRMLDEELAALKSASEEASVQVEAEGKAQKSEIAPSQKE